MTQPPPTPVYEAKGHALGVHDDHGARRPGTGGGRDKGRGGAAGPGPRSAKGLVWARWASNPAARRTWAKAYLGRAPRREKRRTRRGGRSGTPEYGRTGPGPKVGGDRGEEGLHATVRTQAAADSLGRTPPGVCLLEAVGSLPPEVVYGGDWLQMEEMEGQRVATATKAKGARTASEAAAHKDGDTDDD